MIDHQKPAIKLDGVTVRYGDMVALDKASITIPHGTFSGVIGMNGAGKSTLFKVIMGLVKPDSGRVTICERTPQAAKKLSCVAYVPQSEMVDWDFPVSVYDVVMMGRLAGQNIFRTARGKDREATEAALRKVNMYDLKDRQIGELSGGQKKRAFVARAIAAGAEILLLDEPFAGLDAISEKRLTDLLVTLKEGGRTIILATHELTSLTEYCDRIALIKQTVLAYGPTDEIFRRDLVEKTFDGLVHRVQFAK